MKRLFFLFLIATPRLSFSQDSSSVFKQVEIDAIRVLEDGARFFTAPARFSSGDWKLAGVLAGGTAALFAIDQPVRNLSQRNHFVAGDHLQEIGTYYGDGKYAVGLSGVVYTTGTIWRSPKIRETGIVLFESIVFAGVTTTIIKSVVGRSRPYLEEGPTRFRGFQFNNDRLSLPSGHATVAFATSSALAECIGHTGVSIGLYSLAVLTAASRVYNDEHWLSDTFLGAVIGTTSGLAVSKYHGGEGDKVTWKLIPTFNGIGVQMSF